MKIFYRPAVPEDAEGCIALRALTRENAVSALRLSEIGITAKSWAKDIHDDHLAGVVCLIEDRMAGYCFGAAQTGEIVVLAVLPEAEGLSIGKTLLARVVALLGNRGLRRLFLGCSADPSVRSHGFYRHLGWRSTGTFDAHGDEFLEYRIDRSDAPGADG